MNRAEIIALFLRLDEQNPSEPLDGILALTSAAADAIRIVHDHAVFSLERPGVALLEIG